jgi:hypothetical protein
VASARRHNHPEETMSNNQSSSNNSTNPPSAPLKPGDEAEPGTPGTGEGLCHDCGGSGRTDSGAPCPTCAGTGKVTVGIGGA